MALSQNFFPVELVVRSPMCARAEPVSACHNARERPADRMAVAMFVASVPRARSVWMGPVASRTVTGRPAAVTVVVGSVGPVTTNYFAPTISAKAGNASFSHHKIRIAVM